MVLQNHGVNEEERRGFFQRMRVFLELVKRKAEPKFKLFELF
jgi:hypothetical protein